MAITKRSIGERTMNDKDSLIEYMILERISNILLVESMPDRQKISYIYSLIEKYRSLP